MSGKTGTQKEHSTSRDGISKDQHTVASPDMSEKSLYSGTFHRKEPERGVSDDRMKITKLVNVSDDHQAGPNSGENFATHGSDQVKLNLPKTLISPANKFSERNRIVNLATPEENGRLLASSSYSPFQANSFASNLKLTSPFSNGHLPLLSQQPYTQSHRASVTTLNVGSNGIQTTNQTGIFGTSESRNSSINRESDRSHSPEAHGAAGEANNAVVDANNEAGDANNAGVDANNAAVDAYTETGETYTEEPSRSAGKNAATRKRASRKKAAESVSENGTSDSAAAAESKKPRKKRKLYSCEACRKMKTRCDFQPLIAKCHRCVILGIPCSLGEERKEDIKQALEAVNKTGGIKGVFSDAPSGKIGDEPFRNFSSDAVLEPVRTTFENKDHVAVLQHDVAFLANKMNVIEDKLNLILSHLSDQTPTAGFFTANFQNTNNTPSPDVNQEPAKMSSHGVTVENPPFRLLDQIERELFGIYDDPSNVNLTEREILAKAQRAWVVARQKFMEFFYNHEELCFKLAHAFLKKAHFWIIPGGIKKIDREYVEKHPFITSVFAIIAMGFDENENFSTEQEILYPIVERLLSNTLTMFDQLHDHDIEAILYISMYTISRKSKKFRQVKFDGLILSKFATDSLLNLIDFHKIKANVENGLFDGNDLFHLRILNSLTTLKMEYSIGYCNFSIQDKQLRDFNDLTVRFPQSTFGDEIKLGEIKLGDIVNGIFLNFKEFYSESLKMHSASEKKSVVQIAEMISWLDTYKELSSKDGSKLLLFTYDFYYIVILRNILCDFAVTDYKDFLQNKDFFTACLNTMKKYCFAILTAFLKLPTSLIKGAPIITLQQTVYSCLSLCDFLHCFDTNEKARILNLCTKIYWHLNSIGEKLNEATQNVGIIIKTLIDTSMIQSHNNNSSDGSDRNWKTLFVRIQQGCKHNSIKRKEKKASTRNKDNHSSITSVSHTNRGSSGNPYTPGAASDANTMSNNNTPMSSASYSQNQSRSGNSANKFNFGSGLAAAHLNFPDVDQFQSFEEFFQDFFQNTLKPTSQNMFQGK